MTEHTKEPWRFMAGDAFCFIEIPNIAHVGISTTAAASDAPFVIQAAPGSECHPEANARRIVACVNACAGIGTDMLEAMPSGPASLVPMYARLERQRDELLAMLKRIEFDWDGEPEDMTDARTLIAKVEADQ